MKWIKRFAMTLVVFVVLIGAAYYFGTNWLADKAMEFVVRTKWVDLERA